MFTYSFGTNPLIDYPRLMVSDTQELNADGTRAYIFEDEEIQAMENIVTLNFQSSQFFSPPAGLNQPSTPIPYLRVAAGLLDCMASNKAKLAGISRILDVELDPSKAAKFLMDQARAYRDADDNSGSFFIIEQVFNQWSLSERYWNQVARQQGVNF